MHLGWRWRQRGLLAWQVRPAFTGADLRRSHTVFMHHSVLLSAVAVGQGLRRRQWSRLALEQQPSVGAAAQPPGLLDLSPDALDLILAHLELRDRLRLLASCRQLHSLAATSAALWREAGLRVHLRSVQQLWRLSGALRALAPRLAHMHVTCCWLRDHVGNPAAPRVPESELDDLAHLCMAVHVRIARALQVREGGRAQGTRVV